MLPILTHKGTKKSCEQPRDVDDVIVSRGLKWVTFRAVSQRLWAVLSHNSRTCRKRSDRVVSQTFDLINALRLSAVQDATLRGF